MSNDEAVDLGSRQPEIILPTAGQTARFNSRNWLFRAHNEMQTPFRINTKPDALPPEIRKILACAEENFHNRYDDFNSFRLARKLGRATVRHWANICLRHTSEAPDLYLHLTDDAGDITAANLWILKTAYVYLWLTDIETNVALTTNAAVVFNNFADQQVVRNCLTGYWAAAIGFGKAARYYQPSCEKHFHCAQESIRAYQWLRQNRRTAGDIWWESIALRQIAKSDAASVQEKAEARLRCLELSESYRQAGDLMKAALWARDLFDLSDLPADKSRMEKSWQDAIDQARQENRPRDVGKAFWQLYKRERGVGYQAKAEAYRRQAIEWYATAFQAAADSGQHRLRYECLRAICELA